MTYLLALSLGPVQEFIAAARRTADLQAGSDLLVEISRHVARFLAPHGTLIFPADPNRDGPNKLLAKVETNNPAELAGQAKRQAQEYLRKAWGEVLTHLPPDALDLELAQRQIEGFLEFYAAWYPMEDDYVGARAEVERLLAGRKALRDFGPSPQSPGRPKSPLDPSRDCVLNPNPDQPTTVHPSCQKHPLWAKPRETLDAISVLKRVRGVNASRGVPSTPKMAARPVLVRLAERCPEALAKLTELLEDCGPGFDEGDLLYPGRAEEAQAEGASWDPEALETWRKKALAALDLSEAPPYYAILAADGDRMGRLLSSLRTPEDHRHFSDSLSGFAIQAKETVEKQHEGHLVYSGGDDVLALLPVDRALACAEALAKRFAGVVPGATLSVGVAIVHCLESLQVSVERAREAEGLAKRKRNSLAVALHTRGGQPVEFTHLWPAPAGAPQTADQGPFPSPGVGPQGGIQEVWQPWIRAFAEEKTGLARGVPFELRELARQWEGVAVPADRLAERLRAEVNRVLRRKKGVREMDDEAWEASGLKAPPWVGSARDLGRFASLLILARFLSRREYREVHV